MVGEKTVDFLGIGPHEAYIDWQSKKEEIKHLEEVKDLPIKTQISVIKTAYSEIEALLGKTDQIISYAIFPEDKSIPNYENFSYCTVPSIGTGEIIEKIIKKIEMLKGKEEVEKMEKFLSTLLNLTKDSEFIDRSKNQYRKG